MCHATGANSEFWLDCLVRTNRTSCIMLKVVEEPKLNSYLFLCPLRPNIGSVLVLPNLSSVDVWLFVKIVELLHGFLSSSENLGLGDLYLSCTDLLSFLLAEDSRS
jgi:hypothetical protein